MESKFILQLILPKSADIVLLYVQAISKKSFSLKNNTKVIMVSPKAQILLSTRPKKHVFSCQSIQKYATTLATPITAKMSNY